MPVLLATLDLAVTPCVPAAIEETTALGAQVEQVLAVGAAEPEAPAVAAVAEAEVEAGAGDKKTRGRESNEHQVSLQHALKNFRDRLYNRCFWISCAAAASGLRKEIRYSRELGLKKAKRI